MTDISVALYKGESVSLPSGTTVGEALSVLLSNKQRKRTVAARIDDTVADFTTILSKDSTLIPIQIGSEEAFDILRHSTAHVMALAVREIFGTNTKIAIGPSIENGFYYDFLRDQPFSPEDFEIIEEKMGEIIRQALPFGRTEIQSIDAIARFKAEDEKYKVELIQDLETETVSLYQIGEFTDLCRGPHVPNTSFIKAFKLLRVAGAYWRGDEKNDVLQRIYGTSFFDKKDLKKYLHALEEAKKRDHRKLGKELELFTFSKKVGQGLPLWLPKGAALRNRLEQFLEKAQKKAGHHWAAFKVQRKAVPILRFVPGRQKWSYHRA